MWLSLQNMKVVQAQGCNLDYLLVLKVHKECPKMKWQKHHMEMGSTLEKHLQRHSSLCLLQVSPNKTKDSLD